MGGVRPIAKLLSPDPLIADLAGETMIMARCKHGYFGGYPAGSLERMRQILVAGDPEASIWHIPGGKAHKYNGAGGMPLSGYGPNDVRIDLDPETDPDICMDVRDLWRLLDGVDDTDEFTLIDKEVVANKRIFHRPRGIIIDRPYSKEMGEHYAPGGESLPNLTNLLRNCLRLVQPHGLIGVLDWKWPRIPKEKNSNGKLAPIARCVGVYPMTTGEGSQWRGFHVFQEIKR